MDSCASQVMPSIPIVQPTCEQEINSFQSSGITGLARLKQVLPSIFRYYKVDTSEAMHGVLSRCNLAPIIENNYTTFFLDISEGNPYPTVPRRLRGNRGGQATVEPMNVMPVETPEKPAAFDFLAAPVETEATPTALEPLAAPVETEATPTALEPLAVPVETLEKPAALESMETAEILEPEPLTTLPETGQPALIQPHTDDPPQVPPLETDLLCRPQAMEA